MGAMRDAPSMSAACLVVLLSAWLSRRLPAELPAATDAIDASAQPNALDASAQPNNATGSSAQLNASNTTMQPTYYMPEGESNKLGKNLSPWKKALQRAGWTHVSSPQADQWTLLWSHSTPFDEQYHIDVPGGMPALVRSLGPRHLLNHLPGQSWLTGKRNLAKYSLTTLRDVTPPTFVMPDEHAKFLEYAAAHPDDKWMRKSHTHRGVAELSADEHAGAANLPKWTLVQRRVPSLLIDGRKFDVGLYVAITSVRPLRAYVFDNVLLRLCHARYREGAGERATVVTADFVLPWQIQKLLPYYKRGLSARSVLRAHLTDRGFNGTAAIHAMEADVAKLLVEAEPKLAAAASARGRGKAQWVALYRADFMLDDNARPWLVEWNLGPNMRTPSKPGLQPMLDGVAWSFVSLLGLRPGGINRPESADVAKVLLPQSDINNAGWDVCGDCPCGERYECLLCPRCRTADQTLQLQRLVSEHRNREGFVRLLPTGPARADRLPAAPLNVPNQLLELWLWHKCRDDSDWC